MSRVPESIADHFFHPRNVGDASEPSFVGRAASLECGAAIRVSIQIDETHRISQAKFRATGCSTLVSFLSMLTEQVEYLPPADAALVAQHPEALPQGQTENFQCAKLACDALLCAIREYSDAAREEWEGPESLICTCFCISENTIEREIRTKSLTTVSEVTRACSAGGGCGSCHPLIEELLHAAPEHEVL
jgi:NifU-like protein